MLHHLLLNPIALSSVLARLRNDLVFSIGLCAASDKNGNSES